MREKLLQAISKDSKISLVDLAIMLGASLEDVEKEMHALETEGIICGYPTLINWDNTDYERVTALIEGAPSCSGGCNIQNYKENEHQRPVLTFTVRQKKSHWGISIASKLLC